MRIATSEEIKNWDELIKQNPDGGHILQTKAWAEFKAGHGWKPRYVIHELKDGSHIAAVYGIRKMPYFGSMWYAAKGPGVASTAQLLEIAQQLKGTGALAIKFEPELLLDEIDPKVFKKAGLVKTVRNPQFTATVIVDISPSEDELIAQFKQKTRYNIRLAAKKGVTVERVEPTRENLETMYKMMQATQSRAGFFLRTKKYYLGYWRKQIEAQQASLFFACHEGQVLAGLFATHLGSKGWYKDGGSFRIKQNLMAPYLLQWEVMRWLKSKGATSYDMVGVPPRDKMTPEHIMYSLYQFKSGFNPEITEFIGAWDMPLSKKYKLWQKIGERAYTAFLARVLHRYLY